MRVYCHFAFYFSSSNSQGVRMARNILFVLQFVLPLLTMVLSLFISRNREYMADSGAAYLMKDSEPMIGVPNTGRKGGVSGSKLAMSNVDLSRSLTQLIVV